MAVLNATPLIALDAVALDTETTGLDPGKARVVEIAAIRIGGGRIDPAGTLPRLRAGGIRTLAEAEQACRGLTEALDKQHHAGWVEPIAPSRNDAERTLARIDTYPYRHRIRDVMSAPAKFVDPGVVLSDALA